MNDLEKQLQNIKVTPDNEWYSSTYQKIVTESSKKHNNLFFNLLSMTKIRLAFIAVACLTVVSIAGVVIGVNLMQRNSGIQVVALSDQEKRELFENIIANNPQGILKAENKSASTAVLNAATTFLAESDSTTVSTDQARSKMIAGSFLPVSDKILVSDYTNEKGSVTCSYSGYDNAKLQDIYSNTVSSSASYQDSNGNYYSKYENTYKGILIGANISRNTNSSSETYDYKGGKFAVYSKYEYDPIIVQDMPAAESEIIMPDGTTTIEPSKPDDMSIDEYIAMFFGSNANVVGKTTENNKEYFIIDMENYNYCTDEWITTANPVETPNFWEGQDYSAQPESSINPNNKTIVRQWIDSTSYGIYKSEDYLQSVAPENLISKMTYTNSEVEPTQANIDEYFTFNHTTDIRDISVYQTPVDPTIVEYDQTAEVERTFNAFKNSNVALISSKNTALTLNYVYFNDQTARDVQTLIYIPEYYKERDFFPTGEIGDLLFDAENTLANSYKIQGVGFTDENAPKANFAISTKDILASQDQMLYSNFSIYNGNVDDIKIINSTIYSPTITRNISDTTLKFGEEEISAKVYNYETKSTLYFANPEISARGTTSSDLALPADGPCESETECIIAGHIVIFNKNGFKYVATFNKGAMPNVAFTTELFESFDLQFIDSTTPEFESLKAEYLDYLDSFNTTTDAVEPLRM